MYHVHLRIYSRALHKGHLSNDDAFLTKDTTGTKESDLIREVFSFQRENVWSSLTWDLACVSLLERCPLYVHVCSYMHLHTHIHNCYYCIIVPINLVRVLIPMTSSCRLTQTSILYLPKYRAHPLLINRASSQCACVKMNGIASYWSSSSTEGKSLNEVIAIRPCHTTNYWVFAR